MIAAMLFLLTNLPTVEAWNSKEPKKIHNPYFGIKSDGDDTHQWIIERAIQYLKQHRRIDSGSWFDGTEFADLVKWGAAYADYTGDVVTVKCWHEESYRFDQNHHYYHPRPIKFTYENLDNLPDEFFVGIGNAACGPFAHVGNMPATIYSQQLYERAVEFWPFGDDPLNLSTLKEPFYLGFISTWGDTIRYAGWAQGTDPRFVWEVPGADFIYIDDPYDVANRKTCWQPVSCTENISGSGFCPAKCTSVNPPEWPPWVRATQKKPHHTAAIYLGWAVHLVQDLAVVHHALNLTGTHHQEFEAMTHDLLIKSGLYKKHGSIYAPNNREVSQACIPRPYCAESEIPGSGTSGDIAAQHGINVCTKWKWFNQCYPIANDFIFADPSTYNAEWLAQASAWIVYEQLQAMPKGTEADDWNSLELAMLVHDYHKFSLDTAIKATAALIYKFITDVGAVSLPPDEFESNDTYNTAKPLVDVGDYLQLTIDSLNDLDYYSIKRREPGNLTIRIEYDPQMFDPASELTGPLGKYVPRSHHNGVDVFELEYHPASTYLLKIQGHTTGFYDLKVRVGNKKLKPDSYEDNDSLAQAKEFHSGCDYTGLLNIDQTGDDDFYFLKVAEGQRVDADLEFESVQGNLNLDLLDEPAIGEIKTGQTIGPDIQRDSLSACGTSPQTRFRVRGQPNNYSLCLSAHADAKCGFQPPPGPQPLGFTINTSVALENVNVLAFSGATSPKEVIRGNIYRLLEGDQKTGGEVAVGQSVVSMSPEYGFMGPQNYVLIASASEEGKLVVSGSKTQLTGVDFDAVFPELKSTGGREGLFNEISEGLLSEKFIMPCRRFMETVHLMNVSCESVLESAGTPDGVLLTPLKEQAVLYTFPGGHPIGTVKGN